MSRYKRINTRFGDGYDVVKIDIVDYGIEGLSPTEKKKYVFEDIQESVVADALCYLLGKVEALEEQLKAKEGKPSV